MGFYDVMSSWFRDAFPQGLGGVSFDPSPLAPHQPTPEELAAWQQGPGQFAGMSGPEVILQDQQRRFAPTAPGMITPEGLQPAQPFVPGMPGPPPQYDAPVPDPPLHPMSQQDQALWEYGENQMPVPPPPAEPWSEQWVDERYPGPYGEAALVKDVAGAYPYEIEAQRAEQERLANQPGPMEQHLTSYDQRTDDIVSQMEAADKRNKYLQMASGILSSDVGDYTGAMANVFDVQAQYNQRPAEFESFRAQRDTGRLDDLYKIAQARRSAQGPQLPAKMQYQLSLAETEEDVRRIFDMAGPEFKYEGWGGGAPGGIRYDSESGLAWMPGMDEEVNINTPEGNALWTEEMRKAGAQTPGRMKAARKQLSDEAEWERMKSRLGEDGALLLGATPPEDREKVYAASLAAIYAEANEPMPESLNVREEWARIMEIAESDPEGSGAAIDKVLRRTWGQK